MTTTFKKSDLQDWLRSIPWSHHIVIDPNQLRRWSNERALRSLKKMNYHICKRLLHRRFAMAPLDERFHWIAFYQGDRTAGTLHLHILLHTPVSMRPSSAFEGMKLSSALHTAWLSGRDGGPLWPWMRVIREEGDSRSAATYVSRLCSASSWNDQGVQFSQ